MIWRDYVLGKLAAREGTLNMTGFVLAAYLMYSWISAANDSALDQINHAYYV